MTRTDAFTKVIVPILAAIVGALAVHWVSPEWTVVARNSGWVPRSEWQQEATKVGWIQKTDCPAYPVTLRITGPGSSSSVPVRNRSDESIWRSDFVISSTRPIPKGNSVAIIAVNPTTSMHHIVWPLFERTSGNRVFRVNGFQAFPFPVENKGKVSFYAALVDDKKALSGLYSTLDQIKSAGADVALSAPTELVADLKSL